MQKSCVYSWQQFWLHVAWRSNVASSLKIDRQSKNFLSLYLSNPNSIESLLRDMSFLKIWIPTGYRLSKSLNSILVWAPNLDHLKVLDLRDCNLQSIPSSFRCLSSLYTLNPSGNKFECLLESIIQLSKLKTIDLNDCIRLRSLPLLPSSTSLVGVAGCNSLETLPNRLILDKLHQPPLYLFNCFKLAGNQGWSDMFFKNAIWRYSGLSLSLYTFLSC